MTSKHRLRILVPGALALALLGSGCIRSHRAGVVYAPVPVVATPPAVVTVPTQEPAPPPPEARDVAVAGAVKEALQDRILIPSTAHNVLATVDRGVVTLRGSVPSENQRIEIIDRIKRTPGVVRVQDELEVTSAR